MYDSDVDDEALDEVLEDEMSVEDKIKALIAEAKTIPWLRDISEPKQGVLDEDAAFEVRCGGACVAKLRLFETSFMLEYSNRHMRVEVTFANLLDTLKKLALEERRRAARILYHMNKVS